MTARQPKQLRIGDLTLRVGDIVRTTRDCVAVKAGALFEITGFSPPGVRPFDSVMTKLYRASCESSAREPAGKPWEWNDLSLLQFAFHRGAYECIGDVSKGQTFPYQPPEYYPGVFVAMKYGGWRRRRG